MHSVVSFFLSLFIKLLILYSLHQKAESPGNDYVTASIYTGYTPIDCFTFPAKLIHLIPLTRSRGVGVSAHPRRSTLLRNRKSDRPLTKVRPVRKLEPEKVQTAVRPLKGKGRTTTEICIIPGRQEGNRNALYLYRYRAMKCAHSIQINVFQFIKVGLSPYNILIHVSILCSLIGSSL